MLNKNVELGREMWSLLSNEFRQCEVDNGAVEQSDQVQVWAGFLAAASGAMCAQIGVPYSEALLDTIRKALPDVIKSEMQEVQP